MRDLPARTTWPSARSAGAIDMSRSRALLLGQFEGAKYCSRLRDGLSSSTESLLSYAWLAESTEPFPVLTQMLPCASTTGAAPPIQMAPWLSSGAASTVNVEADPPASGTEITRPR